MPVLKWVMECGHATVCECRHWVGQLNYCAKCSAWKHIRRWQQYEGTKPVSEDNGITEAVNEVVQTLRQIPIFLAGQMPRTGLGWCASCVMIYMGEISMDTELQAEVRKMHIDAMQAGMTMMVFPLPERDELQLQPAITVGPSWAYRIEDNTPSGWSYPDAPVCWTHIRGIPPSLMRPATVQDGVQSNLIAGKAYRSRKGKG